MRRSRRLCNKNSQSCTLIYAGNSYQPISLNRYQLDPSQPVHFQQLLKDVTQPIYGTIHLWSLDDKSELSLEDPNPTSILYLAQAIALLEAVETPRLWLVTRGTQSVLTYTEPVSVTQSSVWGMGAVIANEIPNLHCKRLDFDSNSDGRRGRTAHANPAIRR